jgi:predicted RNase H-like HicB family nuclease
MCRFKWFNVGSSELDFVAMPSIGWKLDLACFAARGGSYGSLIFRLWGLSLLPIEPFRGALMANVTQLKIELDQEEDGRWIGEVPTLPGVIAYGQTKAAALAAVQVLALRAMADRLEHNEVVPEELLNVSFIAA